MRQSRVRVYDSRQAVAAAILTVSAIATETKCASLEAFVGWPHGALRTGRASADSRPTFADSSSLNP